MIALIAGTGGLPPYLAASLTRQGRAPIVCEMRGFASEVAGDFTRIPFRIETVGTLLKTLAALDVTHVCMAGALQRPPVDPTAIDAQTAPLVPRLQAAMAKGDDGTLREVIAIFREHGFNVIGAHHIAPDLLPVAGVRTRVSPPPMDAALRAAKTALIEMGARDQGQAVLVQNDQVIAIEDARGTAAMLNDFAARTPDQTPLAGDMFDIFGDAIGGVADWLSGDDLQSNGADEARAAILIKAPKPNQIMEADMPLIGPDTANQAVNAGLAGIAIPAGAVMVLDLPQVVDSLNAHGLFLWVMPEGTF